MGLGELPRAYFSGFTYWNPSTMNNNDYQPTYDPATATLNWSWLERHGMRDPAEFDAYATGLGIVATANSQLDENIISATPPAEWNFYGDNACGFVQADQPAIEWPAKFSKPSIPLTVTGFTNDNCAHITSGDPWIGQPLQLNVGLDTAKLVDVDPICPWSSQIFVDAIDLGSAHAKIGLTGRTAGRAHSRWVFFSRNLRLKPGIIIAGFAGSMWQLCLPTDDLRFLDPSPSPASLAGLLRGALEQPGARGLMLRLVTYHTIYFQGPAFKVHDQPDWQAITELYAEYADRRAGYERGELREPPPPPINRAYSNTVGWLAPWTTNDMRTMAVGRTLHSPGKVQPLDPTIKPTPLGPAVLEYAVDPVNPSIVARVTIDLGSTIPERDPSMTKVDFGTLKLALDATGDGAAADPFAEIQSVDYAKDAYVSTAGVIDITASQFLAPVTVDDLQNRLVVTVVDPETGTTQVGLHEAEFTAETDDRGVYVDQPGAPWSTAAPTIAVQVRYHGAKPPAGTKLRIAQYSPDPPGFGEGAWQLVSATTETQTQAPFVTIDAGGVVIDGAYTIVDVPYLDDGLPYGTVEVAISALRSGPPVLAFTPVPPGRQANAPPQLVQFPELTQQFFANVRALPFHNGMAVAFENWLRTGPTVDMVTQRVFDSVFRTFFIMYPVMRFIRDPLQFQAWRGPVLAATDPAIFETAAYMPVMRSVSAGQRRILELWSAYLDGSMPTQITGEALGRRG